MTWLCVEQSSWFANDAGDHVMLTSATGRFVGAVVTGANPIDLRVETYADVNPDAGWVLVVPEKSEEFREVVESPASVNQTARPQFDLFGAPVG